MFECRRDEESGRWSGAPLYELATGNRIVNDLAWVAEVGAVVANVENTRMSRMGSCDRDDYTRIGGDGDEDSDDYDEDYDEDDDDNGFGDGDEDAYWPKDAEHQVVWVCGL